MKRPRADFHVVGLQDDATLTRPKTLQGQDDVLERGGSAAALGRHGGITGSGVVFGGAT
jgi:hypothetical protein